MQEPRQLPPSDQSSGRPPPWLRAAARNSSSARTLAGARAPRNRRIRFDPQPPERPAAAAVVGAFGRSGAVRRGSARPRRAIFSENGIGCARFEQETARRAPGHFERTCVAPAKGRPRRPATPGERIGESADVGQSVNSPPPATGRRSAAGGAPTPAHAVPASVPPPRAAAGCRAACSPLRRPKSDRSAPLSWAVGAFRRRVGRGAAGMELARPKTRRESFG